MMIFSMDEISKSYGTRTVLDIPRMELEQDKIYAVLGPNGAGKTTLLRILNLLDLPDTGQLKFMGQDIRVNQHERLDIARQMCMVFQKPHMFRTTVYKNVAYGLKLRQTPPAEIKQKVDETLEFVGLGEFHGRLATTLSGGESQRLALARALALQPRVLLLDEPTANLDPTTVQMIEEIIRNYQAKYHMTVIIVTHNLFQAQRIADECILLMDGRVIERGPTKEMFAHPQDDRTRHFLDGTMVY